MDVTSTRARTVAGCLGAVLALAAATVVLAQPSAATVANTGFWHTSGNRILDAAGHPVRIAGVNWYGFETPDQVAHGLWAQDYHTIVDDIRDLGYNTIRIPFSNQLVERPIVPHGVSFANATGPINTDLKNLDSLRVLDKVVAAAGADGLKVILDDHRSEAGQSAEENGLWYTDEYPDQAWLRDWTTIATRYAGNPTVIGFDLRNEPHTPPGAPYARGATWGTGDPRTDVRLAYQRAGDAILAVDPHALIFAEGVGEHPDASGGVDATWWGGDLAEAGRYPVVLSSPGHLVYSPHDYGPALFRQAWFTSTTTPAGLRAVWTRFWGYLSARGTAPVWVGEFGTGNAPGDVAGTVPGSQGQWFSSLVAYLRAHPALGWAYWALNGEDSLGLLDSRYDPTPVSGAKQRLLAGIESGGRSRPCPPRPAPPSPPAR